MNVHLFSTGRLALFTGLSVPCPPSGQTQTEMSRTGCERRAQGEDCLWGMLGHWTNSSIAQIYCIRQCGLIQPRDLIECEDFIFLPNCYSLSFSAMMAQILNFCFCFVASLFRFCFIVFFFLPLKFLWDSSCQSLKISFYSPSPHNRACCSRPAVNCQRLNEKPGGLVM